MRFFRKSKPELLTDFVQEPPLPWTNRVVIPAAGVIASGWTLDNKVFLFSADGYSVSAPITGIREIRNYDEEGIAMNKFSKDNLEFTIDELKQTIKVFGLRGGNGNHITSDDRWYLDSFTPSLGEQIIGKQNYKSSNNSNIAWKNYILISFTRLEYTTLTYGFSPNEKHFGIFGSAGAEIFTRP